MKFKRKLSEVNTRAVFIRQNELIGNFKMTAGDKVSIKFPCVCMSFPMVISSIFVKSFPFPYFVLFVLRYFPFHVVYCQVSFIKNK